MKPANRLKLPTYVRVGVFQLDEVLPYITKNKTKRVYNDYSILMDSLRCQTFLHSGTVCVACGTAGTFFALERHVRNNKNPDAHHFNLYGIDKQGQEVMLTKDHILPKSKGGSDSLDNLQTMCIICNGRKADK